MHNFFPVTVLPTRISNTSATLIDHIYTNCHSSTETTVIKAGVLITDFSDHLSNFIFITDNKKVKIDKISDRPLIRLTSDKKIKQFIKDIEVINWNNLYTMANPNEAYNLFHKQISEAYEKNFPLVRLLRRALKDKLWMATSLKRCSNKKHKLYLKWTNN